MQLIKVVPHGLYARLYASFEIAATTAAEAIEGWSRQVGMRLSDNRVMEAVGFETPESLFEKTDVTELHLMPAMSGGGGFFKIVIGAALIVGGIFVSAIPGLQAVGIAMISAGISLVIGGIMQLFMKSPKASDDKDPEASKYIGAGQNTTAIGTPIAIGGGRMLIGGQYLSLQVNSSDLVMGSFPAQPS